MVRQILIMLLVYGVCGAADPKPILVIIEQNPWLSVIGSDSPTFALYDDGSIYFIRETPTATDPFQSRTVEDAKDKAAALLGFDPEKMKGLYELSAASDQRTTVIWTPRKRIEVYGSWREARVDRDLGSDPRGKALIERERMMWASLPAEIRAALVRIDEERSRPGKPWFPGRVEVMFWPYEYAPETSIVWPKDWPGLKAGDTRKRGDSFSVFLPAERLSELRSFLATRNERGAVLIDGKKMAVATRFPFPGEEAWMR